MIEPRHRLNDPDLISLPGRCDVLGNSLTRRQIDVLKALLEGLSNKEIAERLGLSEGTVKVHMAALFRRLGVTSRTAAVRKGIAYLEGRFAPAPRVAEPIVVERDIPQPAAPEGAEVSEAPVPELANGPAPFLFDVKTAGDRRLVASQLLTIAASLLAA